MLASVLRSETAIEVSIRIMDGFVQMRHFIASNVELLGKINAIEHKQIESQINNDEKFDRIFAFIDGQAEPTQKVFFDGQIFDAFAKLTELVAKAKSNIDLIDGYVDIGTLNILAKKNTNVVVNVFTQNHKGLTNTDIETFNAQYPTLQIFQTKAFHDRFLIIDKKRTYHIGASLKDAGKKCFAISLIEDDETTKALLNRLGAQ